MSAQRSAELVADESRRRGLGGDDRPAPLAVVGPPAPVGRLGLLWAAAALTATALGPVATAVVVVPIAAVAAASVVRAADARRPAAALAAAAGAAAVSAAAVAGITAAFAALLVVIAAAALAGRNGAVLPAVFGVAGPAAAAASLVVAAGERGIVAMALISAVCLWDLAAYAVGTGSTGGVVGTLAGTVSLAVLAVLFAAVADPPLSGARPWVLFALLAVSAPAGVAVGRRLAGDRRLPALRRLDSLLLAGPVWVVGAQLILRHG